MSFLSSRDKDRQSPFILPLGSLRRRRSRALLAFSPQSKTVLCFDRLRATVSCDSLCNVKIGVAKTDARQLRCLSNLSLPTPCLSLSSASSLCSSPPRQTPKTLVEAADVHFTSPEAGPLPFPLISHSRATSLPALRIPKPSARRLKAPETICLRTSSGFQDRFVPARRSNDALARSFKTSKDAARLEPSERLMRINYASGDILGPLRRAQTRGSSIEARYRTGAALPIDPPARTVAVRARNVSAGTIWGVGGTRQLTPDPVHAVQDGHGRFFGSGTNAPMATASFFSAQTAKKAGEVFERNVAAALGLDRMGRMLNVTAHDQTLFSNQPNSTGTAASGCWTGNGWDLNLESSNSKEGATARKDSSTCYSVQISLLQPTSSDTSLTVHTVLDAPRLRDDFYCSVLAFCYSTRTLAVALEGKVYLWSEERGVTYMQLRDDAERGVYVASISFSSGHGGHNILAIGRSNGTLLLRALDEKLDRFSCTQPHPLTCVAFRPIVRRGTDEHGATTHLEDLLVGDDIGVVYYYSIEWETEVDGDEGTGVMRLLARIAIHEQQICGIAWAPDGTWFATGGNDNRCLLFATSDIVELRHASASLQRSKKNSHLGNENRTSPQARDDKSLGPNSPSQLPKPKFSSRTTVLDVLPGDERYQWGLGAAVKAIAFCPWQRALIAVGGGSNDRAIHFYHTRSGATLATINVLAQVTSLIWSKTRREIVATFGFPQPEHAYRIAVFSWPDCQQVLAIPWVSECRALYAIPYPGGPVVARARSSEGGRWWKRTEDEGSIVIACSDDCVRFHEVWSGKARNARPAPGCLGWSDILEGLEGVYKEDEHVIR